MNLKKVVAAIRKNKRFLITTHMNVEGDALGSELALYRLLKRIGKTAVVVNGDTVPDIYNFLPSYGNIRVIGRDKKILKGIKFDCFLIVDCSDLGRCGNVCKVNPDHKTIINIDHHISNDNFGDINWVDSKAASCSEMIYRLYKKMRIPLDRESALLLYVGLLTDTGSFRYSNTSSTTHKIAAELMRHKFNITDIYNRIYSSIPFNDIQLLLKILPQIKFRHSGKVAWFEIKRGLLTDMGMTFDLTENILTFARSIRGVEVTALFKEIPDKRNETRVNLRSQGSVDVNKIARMFGGGGHKTASGATVKGSMREVRNKVLSKIAAGLK